MIQRVKPLLILILFRYNTEEGVGEAIKILIKDKGFEREDVFVTTKVNSDQYTYDKV